MKPEPMHEETEERKYIGYDGGAWYWKQTDFLLFAMTVDRFPNVEQGILEYWTWSEIIEWREEYPSQKKIHFLTIEEANDVEELETL